ncbi:hypothetical protein B0J14DRAFT_656158 [Halenospora varia]|nr:hypothetical protein B0J14DRAFT_656158 [Halenospora varia]
MPEPILPAGNIPLPTLGPNEYSFSEDVGSPKPLVDNVAREIPEAFPPKLDLDLKKQVRLLADVDRPEPLSTVYTAHQIIILPTDFDDIDSTEKMIGCMHLRNVFYPRSKILKHRLILQTGLGHGLTYMNISSIIEEKYLPCTAVKHYEEWKNNCKPRPQKPEAMASNFRLLAVLEEVESCVGDLHVTKERSLLSSSRTATSHDRTGSQFHPRETSSTENHTSTENIHKRFSNDIQTKLSPQFAGLSFALFGGLVLIGPMLIMALHPTKITVLVTTTMFVLSVAIVLAWRMEDAQNKDIVAATAAYAAVLVVFVGTVMAAPAGTGVTTPGG